jgi:hypothetical protein
MTFPVILRPPLIRTIAAGDVLMLNGEPLQINGQNITLSMLQTPGANEADLVAALRVLFPYRGAQVRKSAAQTGINGTLVIYPTFNTQDFDTDGFHSTTVDSDRLTIPAGRGIISVRLRVYIGLTNVGGNADVEVSVFKNGSSTYYDGRPYFRVPASGEPTVLQLVESAPLDVADGDYFKVVLYSDDTSLDILPEFFFGIEVVETELVP